jgi:hypothetical protein
MLQALILSNSLEFKTLSHSALLNTRNNKSKHFMIQFTKDSRQYKSEHFMLQVLVLSNSLEFKTPTICSVKHKKITDGI